MPESVLKKFSWSVLSNLPDELVVRALYFRAFKRLPNLTNPLTFNEKIAWRKLNQPNEQFKIFSDKIAVKHEIASLVGEERVIKTLWIGDDPECIPFDELKPPYVIKTNHGNGGLVFIRKATDIDKGAIAAALREQLANSYARRWREWGYIGIPHKILVEEMISGADGDIPEDYKFFVYHGRVHFIEVDYSRYKNHQRDIYSRDWELLPVKYHRPRKGRAAPRPALLEQMIGVAETIGTSFDFARVDLYATAEGVKFGEVTFYPVAGLGRFEPVEWDAKFGEPWRLPFEASAV